LPLTSINGSRGANTRGFSQKSPGNWAKAHRLFAFNPLAKARGNNFYGNRISHLNFNGLLINLIQLNQLNQPKVIFHKLFCSVFGIGYIKGGGTIGAAVCCVCWYLAWNGAYPPLLPSILIATIITFAGVWSSSVMEHIWGKDPSKVVIDEVAGMAVGLLFLPVNITCLLTAFILFRFFDILKPLYIRKSESLPAGWGIMVDDIHAGIYTNILLQAVVWFRLF